MTKLPWPPAALAKLLSLWLNWPVLRYDCFEAVGMWSCGVLNKTYIRTCILIKAWINLTGTEQHPSILGPKAMNYLTFFFLVVKVSSDFVAVREEKCIYFRHEETLIVEVTEWQKANKHWHIQSMALFVTLLPVTFIVFTHRFKGSVNLSVCVFGCLIYKHVFTVKAIHCSTGP